MNAMVLLPYFSLFPSPDFVPYIPRSLIQTCPFGHPSFHPHNSKLPFPAHDRPSFRPCIRPRVFPTLSAIVLDWSVISIWQQCHSGPPLNSPWSPYSIVSLHTWTSGPFGSVSPWLMKSRGHRNGDRYDWRLQDCRGMLGAVEEDPEAAEMLGEALRRGGSLVCKRWGFLIV